MAGNPLISLGQLNRGLVSVTWPNFTSLNVTLPYLNREGIRLALEGQATAQLPALTGVVQSPEVFQPVTLTINILKSQGLAGLYKAQFETQTVLGPCTVRSDSSIFPAYYLTNMALEGVRELNFSGEDAGFAVMCRGTYPINSAVFS
jgi:hypothetical protein